MTIPCPDGCGEQVFRITVRLQNLRDDVHDYFERLDDGSLIPHRMYCRREIKRVETPWAAKMNAAHWRDYERYKKTGKKKLTKAA